MKQYVTTATINFPAGTVLKLDEEQARSRAHLLTQTDRKGAYLAMDQVQFKKGEEIGLDGDLDKRIQEMLVLKGRLMVVGKTSHGAVAGVENV